MEWRKDFVDLLSLLTAKEVDFLIVGGYAVAFYGAPRFTGDIDILVRPDAAHVNRMIAAVKEFGFPADLLGADYLLERKKILELGRIPVQIHIMTTISGVSWDAAWESRTGGSYGEMPVYYIGLDTLLANKKAAGRPKDVADIAALESRRLP
jgi:hypothetical protein